MNNDYNYSISYSWTQPYSNWSQYQPRSVNLYNEEMMDREEVRIESMDNYPDAESLLKNIFKY